MRYVWSVFLLLVALLVGRAVWGRLHEAAPAATIDAAPHPLARPTAYTPPAMPGADPAPIPGGPSSKADSIVAFALRQLGTPYVYAGIRPENGFDCSGFVMYVFGHYGVATPHSTAMLIDVGRPVSRAAARPGDIVVFTGTAETSTTPGHAGIVLSRPGEPIRFVHASSARRESGVKISQVEGSGYERRFMQVRRVL